MDDLLAPDEQIETSIEAQIEQQIEDAWCDLDAEWHRLLGEARREAARLVHDAEIEAAHVVRDAHVEATGIVDDARTESAALRLEAQEGADSILAAARAQAAAVHATPAIEDPTGIREALQRLRSELSHVVDAALDAFPAIEATADLFAEPLPQPSAPEPDIDLTAPDPVATAISERPGRLRRLLRLAR